MSPGAARVPRAPAAGAAPAQSGGTPSKATVEQFVAATSLEAVSMVGRAAMFLGNAVVDGIEGTAELVQNAAKKADKIAMNVARCVRRRDTPPFPSLFFFAPVPSPRISPPSHAPSLLSAQPRRHPSRPRLPRARRGRVGRFRRREGERDRERAVPPVPGRRRRSGAHGALEPLPGFATRARPRSRVAHRTRRRARLAFVPA